MGRGKMRINVGVGVGNIKTGGTMIIPPMLVGVGVAVGTGVYVGVDVGRIGVGGAAMIGSVLGMHVALVTDPAIHACPPSPPANSMYHHVPSELFPNTLAVPPWGMLPMIL
jgi:hypothetical protein